MHVSLMDILAITIFLVVWISYSFCLTHVIGTRTSLNHLMESARHIWIIRCRENENRIQHVVLNATLHNAAQFFTLTSLIAFGGILTLSLSTDELLGHLLKLSSGMYADQVLFEIKILGLAFIFGYAFFEFSWSYTLFGHTAILIGAIPPPAAGAKELSRASDRVVLMNVTAGRHFNLGLQTFFFALAYIGWFAGPYVLIVATMLVLIVMWRRQFLSDVHEAVEDI